MSDTETEPEKVYAWIHWLEAGGMGIAFSAECPVCKDEISDEGSECQCGYTWKVTAEIEGTKS